MPWVHTDTGEVSSDRPGELVGECPHCEQTRADCDTNMSQMERELRVMRSKVTKAQSALEAVEQSKRDGKLWKRVLTYWEEAFPDKRITSKSMKSARATDLFKRLDAGADELDVLRAIDAAKKYQYVVFGKRVATGSVSDLAIDLQDICSPKNDKIFDWLVENGRAIQAEREAEETPTW